MHLNFYRFLLSILLLLLLLAGCGPSLEELRARRIVEPSLVDIFQNLPHPPIAKVRMHGESGKVKSFCNHRWHERLQPPLPSH